MPIDPSKEDAKKKVADFAANLERRLKNLRPRDYLPFAAATLRKVLERQEIWDTYPPHFILHSMEANCAFHRRGLHAKVGRRIFDKVMKLYTSYDPPADLHALEKNTDVETDLFMLAKARQQFPIQSTWGTNDLAAGIMIFQEKHFPNVHRLFQSKFGIGFAEWIRLCFIVFTASKQNDVVLAERVVQAIREMVSDRVCEAGFDLLSLTIDELRLNYTRSRCELPSILLEYQLQPMFAEKPLVHLDEDTYLVSHPEFLVFRGGEGIYDLCHEHFEDEFGSEMGDAFEDYVGKLLAEAPGDKTLMTEAELSQVIQGKICDYLLAMKDLVLLIECKATSYSSKYVTDCAVRNDNSTTKIVDGMHQLSNVAQQLECPELKTHIGEIGDRMVIGLVVTFKHIWFTHSMLYRSIIDSRVDLAKEFTSRPQAFHIRALQLLILNACGGERLSSLFRRMLDSEVHYPYDWDNYLLDVNREQQERGLKPSIPLLETAWERFVQDAIQVHTDLG